MVCLILGPMLTILTLFTYFLGFDFPTYFSIFTEIVFFYYSCFHCFSEWRIICIGFVDYRNTSPGVSYISYKNIQSLLH